MTYQKKSGGYRSLKSWQTASIIYDFTVEFCRRYVEKSSRTTDQMIQAARSGAQNIAEGSQNSGSSKQSELKLVGVARGSLEELLNDYQDFLRQRSLSLWEKEYLHARHVRALAYSPHRSFATYSSYLSDPVSAANTAICLIHQANFLLDRQLQALERNFLKDGDVPENRFRGRQDERKRQIMERLWGKPEMEDRAHGTK